MNKSLLAFQVSVFQNLKHDFLKEERQTFGKGPLCERERDLEISLAPVMVKSQVTENWKFQLVFFPFFLCLGSFFLSFKVPNFLTIFQTS